MLLSGILISSTGLMAQETIPADKEGQVKEGTAEERARKRTDQMKTELSLTEGQETQIYAINLAHIMEMDKLHEEQKALKEKMKVEREKTKEKIKVVLTPDQNVIFDQKVEEHKKKQEENKMNHQH